MADGPKIPGNSGIFATLWVYLLVLAGGVSPAGVMV
jgi:hypothetical protein